MKEVVDDEEGPEIHGLPILHELGTGHFDDVDVSGADQDGVDGAAHQGEPVHPPVPELPKIIVLLLQTVNGFHGWLTKGGRT